MAEFPTQKKVPMQVIRSTDVLIFLRLLSYIYVVHYYSYEPANYISFLFIMGKSNKRKRDAKAGTANGSQPSQKRTKTTQSDKVNFDGNIKATGIQFGPADGGDILTATANKEVLLAAGSLAVRGSSTCMASPFIDEL